MAGMVLVVQMISCFPTSTTGKSCHKKVPLALGAQETCPMMRTSCKIGECVSSFHRIQFQEGDCHKCCRVDGLTLELLALISEKVLQSRVAKQKGQEAMLQSAAGFR